MKTECLFIYNKYRGNKFAFIVLILLSALSASSQNEVGRIRTDSLCNLLQKTNTHEEKLSVLKELVAINREKEEEAAFEKQIVDVAMQADSFHLAYNAMAQLSRYYYNRDMRDSLLYWNNMIDTISRQRKECPDALFTSGSFVFQEYLWAEEYELAMNEAVRQTNRAERARNEYGQLRANYNQGLIFQAIGQDSNAVAVFRKGLAWFDKKPCQAVFESQYISDMVISTLRLHLTEESESLLLHYEKLLDRLELDYMTKGYNFPIRNQRCQLYSNYAELYTRKGQMAKARKYLAKATSFVSDSLTGSIKYAFHLAEALYAIKTGDDPKALTAINNALEIEDDLDMLTLKMQVLRHAGHQQEAIQVYKKILKMNAAINDNAFNRQISQLRRLNDLNDNEKQHRELQYQHEQIESKQRQLLHILVTICVLLILFFILYRLYHRTHRLKNELLREKDSLVETEKQLRIIKEKAVEADRMKNIFLANISHEVRTPLNAIVGFSELLADDSFPEQEKIVFASTINHSSGLLMSLINDVLELSRLESGNHRFTIRSYEAVSLCREIMAEQENKPSPGVKLTFTSSVESYPLNTDRFRLHQLLGHLLANGIKFTRKGEVNLTFEADTENGVVRFIVTDTGCGIPAGMHEKIFERFEKLDEFKQGTGLGLAVCQLVAGRLGGSLVADSSYSGGARFIFTHPADLQITKDIIS